MKIYGLVVSLLLCPHVGAQLSLPVGTQELPITKAVAIDGMGRWGRRPINSDAIVSRIAEGKLGDPAMGIPKAGDTIVGPGGGEPRAWAELSANEASEFPQAKQGAYIAAHIVSDEARVMILSASGNAMVYVNGAPHVGDPYGVGYVQLPVELRKGDNLLLFAHAGRGTFRAKLAAPKGDVTIIESDITRPDRREGAEVTLAFGLPVQNATNHPRHIRVERVHKAGQPAEPASFTLQACSVTKIPIEFDSSATGPSVTISLRDADAAGMPELAATTVQLPVAQAQFRMTYVSEIDGSVQYMSIVPPAKSDSKTLPWFVLSLHGADVEATNQAASYALSPDRLIACPTNRRKYGFDWEDWGRIDALEAMDATLKAFHTDPTRQYLTGHSMGGHGTWQLGVLYPERFAAIAPSAGWLSFESYLSGTGPAYAPATEIGAVFEKARASCDTVKFMPNLKNRGVYILHGDADDNVPVEQARRARAELDKLSISYKFHEQPGAGHWWGDEHSGAACLDWPAIWTKFSEFTRDPAHPLIAAVKPPLDARGFAAGSFRRAFDRRFILVYSTGGSDAENAWSFAKARFDAEQWWYRGNGYAPIMSDTDFIEQSPVGHNVIVYGNSTCNKAWAAALGDKRMSLANGSVSIDGRSFSGGDIGVLTAIDLPDGRTIGVIGGTGINGMRAVERIPIFTSGAGLPDLMIVRSSIWEHEFDGVIGAGFLHDGPLVWNDKAAAP
jgi:poly(3-hydroxybutyrate) depolymerase